MVQGASFLLVNDRDMNKLLFLPGGLPDGTEVAYYMKGQVKLLLIFLCVFGLKCVWNTQNLLCLIFIDAANIVGYKGGSWHLL